MSDETPVIVWNADRFPSPLVGAPNIGTMDDGSVVLELFSVSGALFVLMTPDQAAMLGAALFRTGKPPKKSLTVPQLIVPGVNGAAGPQNGRV